MDLDGACEANGFASSIENFQDLHVEGCGDGIFDRFVFADAVDEIRNGVAGFVREWV